MRFSGGQRLSHYRGQGEPLRRHGCARVTRPKSPQSVAKGSWRSHTSMIRVAQTWRLNRLSFQPRSIDARGTLSTFVTGTFSNAPSSALPLCLRKASGNNDLGNCILVPDIRMLNQTRRLDLIRRIAAYRPVREGSEATGSRRSNSRKEHRAPILSGHFPTGDQQSGVSVWLSTCLSPSIAHTGGCCARGERRSGEASYRRRLVLGAKELHAWTLLVRWHSLIFGFLRFDR
jgi:hypothetical protein